MAYYIQGYGEGYIAREGDKYQYNVKGKVVGTYDSIEKLVEANPISDGKEAQSGQRSVATESSDDVATESATQDAPKKTTRRKSAKK